MLGACQDQQLRRLSGPRIRPENGRQGTASEQAAKPTLEQIKGHADLVHKPNRIAKRRGIDWFLRLAKGRAPGPDDSDLDDDNDTGKKRRFPEVPATGYASTLRDRERLESSTTSDEPENRPDLTGGARRISITTPQNPTGQPQPHQDSHSLEKEREKKRETERKSNLRPTLSRRKNGTQWEQSTTPLNRLLKEKSEPDETLTRSALKKSSHCSQTSASPGYGLG